MDPVPCTDIPPQDPELPDFLLPKPILYIDLAPAWSDTLWSSVHNCQGLRFKKIALLWELLKCEILYLRRLLCHQSSRPLKQNWTSSGLINLWSLITKRNFVFKELVIEENCFLRPVLLWWWWLLGWLVACKFVVLYLYSTFVSTTGVRGICKLASLQDSSRAGNP